jgi:hypothetical protein
MNKIVFLLVLVTVITSCTNDKVSQSIIPDLAGEWKFVALFSTTQSFRCYECDGFDYLTADPTLNINANGTISFELESINLNGNIAGSIEEENENMTSGNIKITFIQSPISDIHIDNLSENGKLMVEEIKKITSVNLLRNMGSGRFDFIELHSSLSTLIFARNK